MIDRAGFTYTTSGYWSSTITGRVGYALGPMWLLYGKAGIAHADERDSVMEQFGNLAGTGNVTQTGRTAGTGVEHAPLLHWSFRMEQRPWN